MYYRRSGIEVLPLNLLYIYLVLVIAYILTNVLCVYVLADL